MTIILVCSACNSNSIHSNFMWLLNWLYSYIIKSTAHTNRATEKEIFNRSGLLFRIFYVHTHAGLLDVVVVVGIFFFITVRLLKPYLFVFLFSSFHTTKPLFSLFLCNSSSFSRRSVVCLSFVYLAFNIISMR